jgi:alpha-glucosidase
MKKINILLLSILFFIVSNLLAQEVSSPDGKIHVKLNLDEAASPLFTVKYDNVEVLKNSKLGILRDDADFTKNLKLLSASDIEKITDNYTLLHGKQTKIQYIANEKIFHFENQDNEMMDIIFRISDDGAAFRYFFPGKSDNLKTITKESTTYSFPEGTKTWIQPIAEAKYGWKRASPSYEEYYEQDVDIRILRRNEPGWIYPALFKANDVWMCISETAPYRDYCGTRLIHEDGSLDFSIGFPSNLETLNEKEGANPNSTLPWNSPWRIIAIGSDLATIVESTLGTDLAKPSVLDNISYVKPGHSSWSWVMLKDDSTVFKVQKEFIDYASDMGWDYCLVDADWHIKIGYDSLAILADYAATKNVGILAWYNSAGSWNDTPYGPRDRMLTKESRAKEFALLKKIGVKGVKVDFFGGDGQDMMSYYIDIIEDAAKYGIMVNTHGCTLPRGWWRTYPNLVTMEAVKGEEYVTFTQENADLQPNQCCMLPFTRNVFDPMDFTPTVFGEIPGRNRITTNAFELALQVIFHSGIQHVAETAKGMKHVPDYIKQYMKDFPVAWDETKFVDGYPGKLVVMARKIGNTWYVSGINGENIEKDLTIDLSFIKAKKGEFISDITNREQSWKK